MDIEKIQKQLEQFAEDRDWGSFHSPKNLVMALSGEAGELTEIFQWLTEEESKAIIDDSKGMKRVEEEVADIALYLLRLCHQLDIDLEKAIESKLDINAQKYPIALSKGNATKYNQRNDK